MIVEAKTGLPENYQQYYELSNLASRNARIRWGLSALFMVTMAVLSPEYRPPVDPLLVIAGTLILPSVKLPFNIFERGVYLERCRIAREISASEHWIPESAFDFTLLRRVDNVISLAKPLLPSFDNPKEVTTIDYRFKELERQFRKIQQSRSNLFEQVPENMLRNVTRKALNIAENYWSAIWEQPVHDMTGYSMDMLKEIKTDRASLSRETHSSHSDYDPRKRY